MLQTLGSPRDPDSTGSSAGSKSVERCDGLVTVGEEVDAVEVEAVIVVVEAEVAEMAEAEVAEAEDAEADVVEAGFS